MTEKELRERIREFVLGKYPQARKQHVTDETPLIESGLLDSMGVLDLVGFVEEHFAISLADEDLVPENFHSIARLADFVRGRVNGNRS